MADDPRVEAAVAGFDRNADAYEQARPTYPSEAVDLLISVLGLKRGARVCDLAAGTGKLTRLLVAAGLDVVAVEPVEGMRAQLAQVAPDVEVLDGVAEAIPLADASVDAVTVAQAFHWFDADVALEEIRRVLRPGGGVAIVFNRRDERTPWVHQMSEVVQWHARTVSEYERTDWGELLRRHGFIEPGHSTVDWDQPMTRSLLESRVRSISYIALMDEAEQQENVDRVLALVTGFDEPFPLPYTTMSWWAKLPE